MTKQKIAQKFFDLAQRKNIDKITVRDIADECSITRQSFYYHFQDIRAIIEWEFENYVKNLLHKSETSENIDEIIKIFVESITEYSKIINALMKSRERSQFEQLLTSAIYKYLREIIEQKNLFPDLTISELKTVISFYSYALSGIFIEYSSKKIFENKKLTKHLYQIFTGKINFES